MMDQETVKAKMHALMGTCPCGSGKMFKDCCGKEQAGEIMNELCPCGSGKMVKDCCMQTPDAHKAM